MSADGQKKFKLVAGGLRLLIKPLVSIKDVVEGFKQNRKEYNLDDTFKAAFENNKSKLTVVCIDGGGLKGILPVQALIQAERLIKINLLRKKTGGNQYCSIISREKLDEILAYRKERLGQPNLTTADVTHDDFDIKLNEFFEYCAGTSVGSLTAAYVATSGKEESVEEMITFIVNNKLNQLTPSTRLQKVNLKKRLIDEIKEGLENQSYDGILPNQGSMVLMHWMFYYASNLLLAPNPTPNAFFLEPKKKQQEQVKEQKQKEKSKDKQRQQFKLFKRVESAFTLPKEMFSKNRLAISKYSDEGVLAITELLFGDKMLSDKEFFKASLYVPAFDIQHKRPLSFFKFLNAQSTPFDHGLVTTSQNINEQKFLDARELDMKLAVVVKASGAAPTFFPCVNVELPVGYKEEQVNIVLVDGGLVSNNPTQQALTYIQKDLNMNTMQNFTCLSLGCGFSQNLILSDQLPNIKYLIEIVSNVAMVSDTFVAPFQDLQMRMILDDAYLRVQRVSTSDELTEDDQVDNILSMAVDDLSKIDALVDVGQIVANNCEEKMEKMVDKYLVPRALCKQLHNEGFL